MSDFNLTASIKLGPQPLNRPRNLTVLGARGPREAVRASRWETSGLFLGMVTIKVEKVIPSGSQQE